MIQVYSWATPNGHKVHIMLEECGLRHRAHAVDIGAGDQFAPGFLALGPNNKIPAIVDPDGPDGEPISLFESGAILLYLAARIDLFLPASVRDKYDVLQWLMFQRGGVMNKRLAKSRSIGGAECSIADIAVFPWLRSWENQVIDWNDDPHLRGWFDEIGACPAAESGPGVRGRGS